MLSPEQRRLVLLLDRPVRTKQAFGLVRENGLADLGITMIPGVGNVWGAARSLQDAGRAFGRGNYLGALGNAGLAAVNAVPFVGGVAAKALRIGANPMGRFLARPNVMPTFAKPFQAVGRGLEWMGRAAPGRLATQQPPQWWAGNKFRLGANIGGGVGLGLQEANFDAKHGSPPYSEF